MTRAILLFGLLAILLGGCTTTKIQANNPLLATDINQPQATVYFLRPMPQRTRGVSDADLKIELDQKPLLELSRGEYSMVKLKAEPSEVNVIIRSMTHLPYKPVPQEVWRARSFKFEPWKTYYVLAKFDQEEFRGIYFVPTLISEAQARELAKEMSPAGELAEKQPIFKPAKTAPDDSQLDDILN